MRRSCLVLPVVLVSGFGCLPDDPKEASHDSAADGGETPDGEPPGGDSAEGSGGDGGGDDEGGDDGGSDAGGGTDDGGVGGGTDDGDDGDAGDGGDEGDDSVPVVEVSPADNDLGTVYLGCEFAHALTVANVGGGELIVSAIDLTTASAEFTLQSFDASPGPLPWAIAAGDSQELTVVYVPRDSFADTAYIQVESDDPTTPTALAVIDAHGAPYAEQEDVFEQPSSPTDTFVLTQTPVPATLVVEVDGVVITVGWTYDSASNSVVFDTSYMPEPGSTIQVEYALAGPC